MTEYELLDLVAGAIDSMYDSSTLFLSLVSGYLLVAYLVEAVGYHPRTPIQERIDNFIACYMEHMHRA